MLLSFVDITSLGLAIGLDEHIQNGRLLTVEELLSF